MTNAGSCLSRSIENGKPQGFPLSSGMKLSPIKIIYLLIIRTDLIEYLLGSFSDFSTIEITRVFSKLCHSLKIYPNLYLNTRLEDCNLLLYSEAVIIKFLR